MKGLNKELFPATPAGFHNRIAQTIGRLEEKEMKKSKMAVSVLAVAAVLVTTAVAACAAAGLLGGFVNWNGEFTPQTEENMPAPTPEPEQVQMNRQDALAGVPEGEYWCLYNGGDPDSGSWQEKAPQDMEGLAGLLEGSVLRIPQIPEEYCVEEIAVSRSPEARREIENSEPSETTDLGDGYVLRKYRLTELTAEEVWSYSIYLRSEDDEMFVIDVGWQENIEDDDADGVFGADSAEAARVIEVAGMDRALYIASDEGSQRLHMQYMAQMAGKDESVQVNVDLANFGAPVPLETLVEIFAE